MSLATDAEGELLRQVMIAKGGSKPIIDSYNHFIRYRLPDIVSSFRIVTIDGNVAIFSNISFVRPVINDLSGNGKLRPLYPFEARQKSLSYTSQLFAKLQLHQNVGGKLIPIPGQVVDVFLGKIPVMIHSEIDHLVGMTEKERYEHGEGEKDPGGYFIIKGAEKVLLNIEKLRSLAPFMYEEKGKVRVRYTSQTLTDNPTIVIVGEDHNNIYVTFTKLNISNTFVNIFYIFYVLGLTRDTIEQSLKIMNTIIVDDDPHRQMRRQKELRNYLQTTINTFMAQTNGDQGQIFTILAGKFRDSNILNSINRNAEIVNSIRTEIFKNVPMYYQSAEELNAVLMTKIRMLASMVVKYVDFRNGYRDVDDRDSWGNKRLVDPGNHMTTRFFQIWKTMITNIQNKTTSNRLITAIAIRGVINQSSMTEQFINSFSKELWGGVRGTREVVVVDTLKRDTLLASWAHIRRISTPTNRRAKIRDKRLIHNTQWGAMCPVMTPEGEACCHVSESIRLSDGSLKAIGELKDGDEIITIDPISLEQEVTKIYNHFVKSSKDYGKHVLKITTLGGREITCTDDHPFLTQYGWTYARNLKSTHLLSVWPGVKPLRHLISERKIILDSETFRAKLEKLEIQSAAIFKYIRELTEQKLLPLYNDHKELPILSRIVGFMLIGKDKITQNVSRCFETEYDSRLFTKDMAKLGFRVKDGQTIADMGSFVSLLSALGLFHEISDRFVPDWILQGSPLVKREFVAGLQGKNGSKITWVNDQNNNEIFNLNSTFCHNGDLDVLVNQIVNIFHDLNIDVSLTENCEKSTKRNITNLNFSSSEENIIKYMETVGYRYNTIKSTQGHHLVEYLKYKHSKMEESGQIFDIKGWLLHTMAFNDCIFIPIKSVESHPDCMVADFTTESDTHSMISGNFITHNCGLVKDAALTTYLSLESDESIVRARLSGRFKSWPVDLMLNSLYLNGVHLGYCNSKELYSDLIKFRRSQQLFFTTGISMDVNKDLWIYTNAERICRPLLIVDPETQELVIDIKKLRGKPLFDLMSNGALEYIDIAEQEQPYIFIAETVEHLRQKREELSTTKERYEQLRNNPDTPVEELRNAEKALRELGMAAKYTHAEIDPTAILGISAGIIPLPEFNPAARNTYQCLHPDTLIRMADGSDKKIKDIRIGDTIITFDPHTYHLCETIVTNQYVKPTNKPIVRVTSNWGDEIICTDDHLFMTDNGWVKARDLEEHNIISLSEYSKMLFVGVKSIVRVSDQGNFIADITTESNNHSFIANGFGVHNSGMGKQALGPNSTRIELRYDTTVRTISEPGVPIFATDAHETIGLDKYPAGQQIILAITTYGGENQEDALVFNRGSIQRGLFRMVLYYSYKTTICQSTKHHEKIQRPDYPPSQAYRYSKLDPTTNIVRVGRYVVSGDCLVGKVVIDKTTGETKNVSLYVEIGKKGVVEEVFITENAESCKLIRIRIREYRMLQPGDKLASRYAQKGTIGGILPEENMPFIISPNQALSGVRPDIIFNPHGLPSRMTIGKLIELIVGRVAVVNGERVNATAFRRFDYQKFRDQLFALGFSKSGKEVMMNGMTGRKMDVNIFIGPTYYQLLRHLVEDKMQARGTGTVQFLTRQPPSGIRKEGGLRLGEMERDALIEHGASHLLQERMVVSSDAYQAIVCEGCGILAVSNERGEFRCQKCKNGTFGRVTIPYTNKLLIQLLAAANINMRLRTREI